MMMIFSELDFVPTWNKLEGRLDSGKGAKSSATRRHRSAGAVADATIVPVRYSGSLHILHHVSEKFVSYTEHFVTSY